MCAIGGEIDYNGNALLSEQEKNMLLDTMSSRGPDQNGIFESENITLLHARLCVIDIENGKQPMTVQHAGNEYTLVYNGELYNTEELRKELLDLGCTFFGHSDTEVLLKSYTVWGAECVTKFNGIFAFAIWEKNEKKLFVARDRMGVKPFFYTVKNGKFLFASELKTILKHPHITPEIDTQSIAELLLIGPGRTPGYGVFKDISELPPACCGYYTKDGLSSAKYWSVTDQKHTDPFGDTVKNVRFLVEDSIRRQLVSDVPLCTFLSGGLDSSIISSVASNYFAERGEKLHTYSVFYKDNEKYFTASKFQPNSDNEYIDAMTKYLNCENHKIILDTEELVDALFLAVDARDLPGMADVDSSLLLLCREMKKDFTVALSGECADEIFGGYPWYRDKTIREAEGFPWAQSTQWRSGFLKEEFASKINAADYVYQKYRKTADSTDLSQTETDEDKKFKIMINLNLQWFMQTLLDRKDRMSMYSGLEVRVPFCDYRIADYLYSTPWEYKDYNHYEKGLLREAVRGILPEKVLWRKKSPYPKTHNPAYLNAVTARLNELIATPSEPIHDLIKKEKLIELIQSQNQTPWYGQLMNVPQTIAYFLQLNYWMKQYKVKIV
jgi:asparagine synthase (glutamine-hydrolyzing)